MIKNIDLLGHLGFPRGAESALPLPEVSWLCMRCQDKLLSTRAGAVLSWTEDVRSSQGSKVGHSIRNKQCTAAGTYLDST